MRPLGLALILALAIVVSVIVPAAAQTELVLQPQHYTSEKAKRLATTHRAALEELSTSLYHCLPWLEIQRGSIGFFKPKHATTDDRYLSVRVFVEQEASASFARLGHEQRAAAMFSRYVGHLIQRMTANKAIMDDPDIAGFTTIIEWVKPNASVNGRAVHETIAVFVDKTVAQPYLTGRASGSELGKRARVLGFDGETALGELRLAAWDDDFASTFQVRNYKAPNGLDCRLTTRSQK
jgi:hypothetical protein